MILSLTLRLVLCHVLAAGASPFQFQAPSSIHLVPSIPAPRNFNKNTLSEALVIPQVGNLQASTPHGTHNTTPAHNVCVSTLIQIEMTYVYCTWKMGMCADDSTMHNPQDLLKNATEEMGLDEYRIRAPVIWLSCEFQIVDIFS